MILVAVLIAGSGIVFGLVFDLRYSRRPPSSPPSPPPSPSAGPAGPTVATPPSVLPAPPVAPPPMAGPAAAPVVSPPPPPPIEAPPAGAGPAPSAWAVTRPAAAPASAESPALLTCRGVHVAYGDVRVLFGVDLDVGRGEIVALLGTNGAGKSTLLRAISGLVIPVEGTIVFDGRDITRADAGHRAALGIVQVPGGKAIFPTLTVAEHFKAASWLFHRQSADEVRARTERVLAMFPRLEERWDNMAGNLSGGEQQQLGLGMAFVANPKLLIIDELSLGLAPTVVEQLLDIVRAIHAQGCTVILVEQSVNVALTIAHRAYFMEKGEIRFEGPAAELLERPDLLRSVFLQGAAAGRNGEGPPAPGIIRPDAAAETTGRRAEPVNRPVALRVRGLTKTFGGISAVEDVSFDLCQGQALGLIGPNGAGKTTIFDLISGVIPADGGSVELDRRDITSWAPERRARAGLGRSFQDARIFPSLTVAENIALGLERHIEVRDHLASLLALPAVQESELGVRRRVEELIELMGLGAYHDKFVSELSTGVRRVVDLAMVLGHEPSVLLLDEPSSGIAQRETEALGVLLTNIQREMSCSMLLIEHDMPLVAGVCDELLALDLGSVIARGRPADVLSDPVVATSYLGGDLRIVNRSGGRGVGR